jgi:hypothetical protein
VNNEALKSSTHENPDKKKTLNFNLARRKSRLPVSFLGMVRFRSGDQM